MRITRLKFENWRNFRRLDIELRDRAFFIGPNASGKSNLLDAVKFLRDVAAASGGGLQEAVRKRGGVSAVRCLAARQASDVLLHVEIGDDAGPAWSYALTFRAEARKPGRPVVVRERVARFEGREERVLIDRPTDADAQDAERLVETHLEQVSANKEFREIAEFLRSVGYLHPVPQIIRDPARFGDDPADPYGGHLLADINKAPKRDREARLRRMNEALRIAVPQLGELQLDLDEAGTPHLKAKYSHWRPQGAWQREDQFSDGTLRLLGLIWALTDKGGPLLLEEPELSLHAAVVAQLAAVIHRAGRKQRKSPRQTLVTTHSDVLLGDRGIGLDEVFVLRPGPEGTEIVAPGVLPDIRAMVESGLPLAEAVAPLGRPEGVENLPLFAERRA